MQTITWFNEMPHTALTVPASDECVLWIVQTVPCVNEPLEIRLGENATLALNVLVVIGGEHAVDARITIVHEGAHSVSRVRADAVLFGASALKLEPCARILKGARGADANVSLHTLIAGDTARDTSIPSMEIDEQDVRAKHAATIGRVGDEELFYLQTRGVDAHEAERCMITGFVRDCVKRAPQEHRSTLHELLTPYNIMV